MASIEWYWDFVLGNWKDNKDNASLIPRLTDSNIEVLEAAAWIHHVRFTVLGFFKALEWEWSWMGVAKGIQFSQDFKGDGLLVVKISLLW